MATDSATDNGQQPDINSINVLEAVRAKYPQYANVDDAELAMRLAQKYPQYLQNDEFAKLTAPMRGTVVVGGNNVKPAVGVSTIAGGPKVQFGGSSFLPESDYAESGNIIPTTPQEAVTAPSVWAQRGGKFLLGAMVDLASTMKGEPSTANMASYANTPEAPMPVEQGIAEMHGLSSVPTKAAAGLIQAAPALGISGGLAMAGAPAAVAASVPMLTDKEGQIDPIGAVIAAGLPGASKLGENFVAKYLAKLPTAHVVAEVLSRDPLQIKAKVVQRLGGIEISNDTFRKYLEAGGGAVAANAYLLATQAPGILALPADQRGEAITDAVAGNLATSLLAFTSRGGTSGTLKELYPKLQKLWEQTQDSRAVGGAPGAEPTAPEPAQVENQVAIPPVQPEPSQPAPPTAPPMVPVTTPVASGGTPPPISPAPETTSNIQPAAPASAANPIPEASLPGAGENSLATENTENTENKEPWQMTKAEYSAMVKKEYGMQGFPDLSAKQTTDATHAQEVAAAVKAGKPVPPEVLADYPDLKTSTPPVVTSPTPAPTEPQAAPATAQALPKPPAELPPNELADRIAARYKELAGDQMSDAVARKNSEKLAAAIQAGTMHDLLRPDNKLSRKIYEEITGRKLPATVKGTKAVVESGKPEIKPATAAPAESKWNKVGVNSEGKDVFEDERSVRSVLDGNVRVTEPVAMIPTRAGIQMATGDRTGTQFETVEKPAAPTPATPAPVASENFKPDVTKAIQLVGKPELERRAKALLDSDEWVQQISGDGQKEGVSLYSAARMTVNGTWKEPTPFSQPKVEAAKAPIAAQVQSGKDLANTVRATLANGADMAPSDVQAIAQRAGLSSKEAAEWAELGATLAARDIAQNPKMTPVEKFHALVSLYNRMPTNGERTVDTRVKQQYSTPPPLAYVAQVLADFANGKVFVEPTAGHGMLMIGANPQGAVALNELDENRDERLKVFAQDIPKKVITNLDATSKEFHDKAAGTKPDRVGMNPPFGSVLGKDGKNKKFEIFNASTKQKETTSIDAAIMLNTFDALTPDGKGFAIIGAKTGTPFGGTFGTDKQRTDDYNKAVYLDLFKRFKVADWFTIGGDLYRKMGAAWPVDVIIVHGKGETPSSKAGGMVRPWIKPPRVIDSWEQLAELLPKASYDNIKPVGPAAKYEPEPRPIAGEAGGSPGGTHPEPVGAGAGRSGATEIRAQGHQQPAAVSRTGGGGGTETPAIPSPTPQPPESVNGVTSTGIGQGTAETNTGVDAGGAAPKPSATPAVGGGRPVAAGSGAAESGREPVRKVKIGDDIDKIIETIKPVSHVYLEDQEQRYHLENGQEVDFNENTRKVTAVNQSKPTPVKPSVPVEGMPAALVVPYQGASKGPSLNLVSPRNLAGSMLNAQQQLEQAAGKSIDQYLAEKLLRTPAVLHTQLAGAQVDGAALAIRNIERGGALINTDQGGVGKGRQVAALILYAKARGLVPVFVTAKKNLYQDMVARDLPALGDRDFVPFITDTQYTYENGHGKEVKGRGNSAARTGEMENIIRTGQLPNGAHGIFTTYDQLKGDRPAGFRETPREKFRRKNAKQERPDGPRWAMLRALAPRALFILDEAHEAAGPQSELNMKFSSVLPNAHGVYYSSATFAKRPDNMGIYALGTSIRRAGLNNEQLAEALQAGGVPLQQALTSMLADAGELVRREQDWDGVNFLFKQTSADEAKDVEAADTYTSFIRDLMQLAKHVNAAGDALNDAENQVRAKEEKVDVEPITFGSRLFNLSNQYLLALRSDAIVREAISELKAGRKPFIALYNTMEGPLLDLKARKLPLSFNGILRREMQKMLTLTVKDPQAEDGKRKVELKPEDLPDGGAFYRQLEAQIDATDFSRLPISPIDHIKKGLQAAGYTVGELTARDGEVNDEGDEIVITKREKQERNKILSQYNNGGYDSLLVNGSGSTGLSAHTDPRFKDQRPRTMLVGQGAPDINQFMQMLWRIMRSGQTSKPKYIILTTALAAERRFATMLRGKMASLNANTTAESESGMTQQEGFADDVFNSVGDSVVQRVMAANMELARLMDLETGADADDEGTDGYARKATGRFVLLPNADAQRLWDEIIAEFKDEIAQLDEQGQNPLKAAAEDLKARTIEKSNIVDGTGETPFDGPAVLEKCIIKPPKAPPTHAEAKQRASDNIAPTRDLARAWLEKSKAAQDERLRVAAARGATADQLDRIRDTMEGVRQQVQRAFRKLGDTFAVDLMGDGSASFHGVAGELKLADKQASDFSSASRQQLILTTNTFKGRFTVPLSKLFNDGDETGLLQPLDDGEAEELFNQNAESSAERHIITGNLLRGWEAASNAVSGTTGARPRVAIYTKEDGSLGTGILMPPGYDPAGQPDENGKPVTDANHFAQLYGNTRMRSVSETAGGWINLGEKGLVQIPSNGAARYIWGDPLFKSFFRETPSQTSAGAFVGWLKPNMTPAFYEFLKGKNIRLFIPEAGETAAMKGGGSSAARGAFISGVNRGPGKVPATVQMGGMQFVRPLELPELVRLARDLTGRVPKVRKLSQRGNMVTSGQFGDGMISLDPLIFRDSRVAAMVLGHELGHLVDYLPHETLKRGNLLGHLLALKGWLKNTFGPLNNKALREELLAVTKWWRPFDEATDPKSYVEYRKSAEELYADALSVMFNAPAELEQRAPKFYEAFWKELNRRPDVQQALFAVQDLLNKGQLETAKVREQELRQGFAQGEQIWKQAVNDRKEAAGSWANWLTGPLQALYWKFYPMQKRVAEVQKRGVAIPPALDPEQIMDDLGFKDVDVMRFGRTINEKVIQPIEQAGMTLDDAGLYLFYNRVLNGDRSGLANPGGMTPDAARLGLLKMRLELGMDQMQRLTDAVARFQDEVFKLAQQAVQVGAYNAETFKNVIAPNKGAYATFAVLDYLDDFIPAGIKSQMGTLKAVANPFTATLLKSVGVINLIAHQKAKNGVLNFLNTFYPGEVEANRSEHPVAPKGKGLLMRLENGRPTTYNVDPYIASMFEQAKPHQVWKVVRALNWTFNKFIHPVLISYNPAFGVVMFGKDAQRTARNLPGWRMSTGLFPLDMLGNVGEAASRFIAARDYTTPTGRAYTGTSSPLMRQMEALHALGTPFDTLVRANRDDFMADLLRRMHQLPAEKAHLIYNNEVMKPVAWLFEHLELLNLIGHTVSKPAAFNRLVAQGMDRRQAAVWVRNYAGLANIQKKGAWVRYLRALRPFWNVWVQTIAADLKLAKMPNTRGGWWLRYMSSNGMLRTLLALGAAGAFGAAFKELFDGISDYNKTKKLTIPVGTVAGGEFGKKVAAITIPEDDTARFIGGIITHGINALAQRNPQELHGIIDLGMNELPSYNPIWNVPFKWTQLAAGQNPVDDFTGHQIIPDRNFSAGGLNAVEPMLGWTLRQSGLLNFYKYDPQAGLTWQAQLPAMPGINRFLTITDQGYREQQRAAQTDVEAQRNMQFLQLPPKVQSLELEYWRLARTPQNALTPPQQDRLADLKYWYNNVYRPAWTDIQDSVSNTNKAAAATARNALDKDSAEFYRVGK
jgi:C-terminal domain on Strawberry notch homologue/P-loop containing NTP hydrolase pore-1